jgi:DNA-binding NarL/FixJ family response regulator
MTQTLTTRPSPADSDEYARNLRSLDGGDADAEGRVITVLIACGDNFSRAGARAMLATQPDIAVVGCAADGEETLAMARQLEPDVTLVDIGLPGMDAVEVTRRLALDRDLSELRVVIVSVSEQDEEVFASLRAGASGLVLRSVQPGELIRAVRAVAAGNAALPPGLVRRVITELASRPDPRLPVSSQLDELTRREREVMALVALGLSNSEIAEHLVVAPATARTHVSRALCKLRVRDRAQLVTVAYETGLVRPTQTAVARCGVTVATVAA